MNKTEELREAFAKGALYSSIYGYSGSRTHDEAIRRYPFPLRTVEVNGAQFRYKDGRFETRPTPLGYETAWSLSAQTPDKVRALYELIRCPSEGVCLCGDGFAICPQCQRERAGVSA